MKKFWIMIILFVVFILLCTSNFRYQENEIARLTMENNSLKATVYEQKVVLNYQAEQLNLLKKLKK
jgi:hypothetical protein